MDTSGCPSLVLSGAPLHRSTRHNNKVNRVNCLSWAKRCPLYLYIAALSFSIASAQAPHPNSLEPPPNEFEVSVAELKVPAKAWRHLREAHKALTEGKLKEAAGEVDRAVQIAPDCAAAFSMKAFIELAGKNPLAAVEDATRATFMDPYNAESFVALAMAYNSSEGFASAQRAAEQALKIRPDSWQGRLELAKSRYGQKQYAAALRELDLLGKNFADVHLLRGNVLMCLGRSREGAAEFSLFTREAPQDHRVGAIKQIIASAAAPGAF